MTCPLVVLVGPTATGKTALAVELARRLDGEVISADSMQVYRYMDIGTAKPTVGERQGVPHHLIDVVDPDQDFNAALYGEMAREAVRGVVSRRRWPILAGGTGLYIRAVTEPFSFGAATGDPDLRRRLEAEAAALGGHVLHRRLAAVDPQAAFRLHPNDLRRVVRALEVYLLTGTPLSRYQQKDRGREREFRPFVFGLTADRAWLYRRIEERVDRMLEAGLLAEVEGLLRRGYGRQLTSMQGLGYKELAAYLAGETDYRTAVETVKRGTRRLAKRQWTWFGRVAGIHWFTAPFKTAGVAGEIEGQLAGVPRPGVEKMSR